jgi:hypothetical protein
VALLLERQGGLEAAPVAPAEVVAGRDLGRALRQARERRKAGACVRFGNGEGR